MVLWVENDITLSKFSYGPYIWTRFMWFINKCSFQFRISFHYSVLKLMQIVFGLRHTPQDSVYRAVTLSVLTLKNTAKACLCGQSHGNCTSGKKGKLSLIMKPPAVLKTCIYICLIALQASVHSIFQPQLALKPTNAPFHIAVNVSRKWPFSCSSIS